MDDKFFVQKLIELTKQDAIEWNTAKVNQIKQYGFPAFYTKRNNIIIFVQKYKYYDEQMWEDNFNFVGVLISVCDEKFISKHEIRPDENEAPEFFMLYDIVQRKANNIDSMLDNFLKDAE